MAYWVAVPDKVLKKIARMPDRISNGMYAQLRSLRTNPRPDHCEPMRGKFKEFHRIDLLKDYRIVYKIEDKDKVVKVYIAGDRKDVYR